MILNHFYPRVPQTSEYQPLRQFCGKFRSEDFAHGRESGAICGRELWQPSKTITASTARNGALLPIIFAQTGRPAILRRSTHSEGSKGRTFPRGSSTRWNRKARRRAFRLHSGGTERERGAQGVLRVPVMEHGAIALRRHAESVWLTIHPHKKSPVGQFRLHGGFLRGIPVPPA